VTNFIAPKSKFQFIIITFFLIRPYVYDPRLDKVYWTENSNFSLLLSIYFNMPI